MADFDVFNGDADGICALLQLRLAEPRDSELITGVKRDIQLLQRVDAARGDRVTVLDISLDKNRADLDRLLAAGADVAYVDHHYAGEVPEHPRLRTTIDTALLVNGLLGGKFWRWAAVGAFGDNLYRSAERLLSDYSISERDVEQLKALGTYINYNGYGAAPEDLHFVPDQLYQTLLPFDDPLAFIAQDKASFQQLEQGFHEDMAAARAINPEAHSEHSAVFVLPAAPWARRVSGVFSNELANEHPGRAHAVLTEKEQGGYLASVRAPLENKTGADELCRRFDTGGGRAAAAGINHLPAAELQRFIDEFSAFFAR